MRQGRVVWCGVASTYVRTSIYLFVGWLAVLWRGVAWHASGVCACCMMQHHSTFHVPRCTVHSPRSTVHSPQSTVHSPRSTVHSPQSTVHSPRSTFRVPRSRAALCVCVFVCLCLCVCARALCLSLKCTTSFSPTISLLLPQSRCK